MPDFVGKQKDLGDEFVAKLSTGYIDGDHIDISSDYWEESISLNKDIILKLVEFIRELGWLE